MPLHLFPLRAWSLKIKQLLWVKDLQHPCEHTGAHSTPELPSALKHTQVAREKHLMEEFHLTEPLTNKLQTEIVACPQNNF